MICAGSAFLVLPFTATMASAACPTGQITCKQWCKLHKPANAAIQQGCVYTDRHSCSNNYGGNINKCVPKDGKERWN
jgi:hypothetical protein